MEKNSIIYVAGHRGLVGSSLERCLRERGFNNIISRTRQELDLRDSKSTESFFIQEKPEYVFAAAAKVGGIKANIDYPADFIYDNISIQMNLIHSAFKSGVKKLLFLGSSCIYPRECPQPIKEESFLSGPFEPTNQAYAVAKTSGIEMCKAYFQQHKANFISVIPCNLFGPGENFDPKNSHLMAALIKRFHDAKTEERDSVTLWGSGTPRREFMYVDNVSDACLFLMQNYDSSEVINVGVGEDLTINELANKVKQVVGYEGKLLYDPTKPDGMMRKLLDSSKLNKLGWKPQIDLEEGIKRTYYWFLKQ